MSSVATSSPPLYSHHTSTPPMLFNCFSCGKLISLKKELCPYCMVDLNAARESVEAEMHPKKAPVLRKKYTFFGLLSR